MNQEEMVLQWLKEKKPLNKTIAMDELNILHLNTKIKNLRDDGFEIEKDMAPCEKTGKKIAWYHLEKGRF